MGVGVLVLLIALVAGTLWYGARQSDPVVLRFSAGTPDGEYHDFTVAVQALVASNAPDIAIEVIDSNGAAANAAALAAGDAELGLVQSDTVVSPGVEAVVGVFPEVLHLVARLDADIDTPAGLGGKSLALMPRGSGSNAVFWRIMAHYGYGETDFDVRYLPARAAMAALQAGEVDAIARMIALGNEGMRELLRDPALELVPIDQAEAIRMFVPALERTVIPRGALNGRPPAPSEDIEALGVRAVLMARNEVPAGTIRRLTELLFESRNQLLSLDEQTALLGSAEGEVPLGFPVHSGAQSYFDADKPLFLVEYADSMALGLSALVVVASTVWQATRWIERRRKNRGDAYNGTLARIVEELRVTTSRQRIDAIETEIYATFKKVVDDIDKDRLAADALPAFDFVWRSATDLLSKRRAELSPSTQKPDYVTLSKSDINLSRIRQDSAT